MVRRDKTNYIIQSVSHALDVIEQFKGEADELGVTELSKRLKLHKNNVFRLLATLEARGYIEQNKATENYRLGVRCLHLGQRFASQLGLLRQARPVLEELAAQCKETAFVTIRRGAGAVSLEAAESNLPVRLVANVGATLPLHCTAPGKAHLTSDSEDEIKAILPERLPARTPRTITDRAQFLEELRKTAERGYAVEIGEYEEHVNALAAPIRDYTNNIVAALAVAGPEYRVSEERIARELAPLIVKAGRDLSVRLGYNPPSRG